MPVIWLLLSVQKVTCRNRPKSKALAISNFSNGRSACLEGQSDEFSVQQQEEKEAYSSCHQSYLLLCLKSSLLASHC